MYRDGIKKPPKPGDTQCRTMTPVAIRSSPESRMGVNTTPRATGRFILNKKNQEHDHGHEKPDDQARSLPIDVTLPGT